MPSRLREIYRELDDLNRQIRQLRGKAVILENERQRLQNRQYAALMQQIEKERKERSAR